MQWQVWALLLLTFLAILSHGLFVNLDGSPPTGDATAHLLLTLDVNDYMAGTKGIDRLRVFFDRAPNYFYPPFPYVVATLFYWIIGVRMKAALLSKVLFTVVLLLSSYALGRKLWGDSGGLLAALCSISGPVYVFWSTSFFQDTSVTAMVILNLALMYSSDSFRRLPVAVAAGLSLGLAMLTKQTSWVYVLPAWAYFATGEAWMFARSRRTRILLILGWLVVPGAIVIEMFRILVQGYSPAKVALIFAGYAAWVVSMLVIVWIVGKVDSVPAESMRRELVRSGNVFQSLGIAIGVAGFWLARSVPDAYRLTVNSIVPQTRQAWVAHGHYHFAALGLDCHLVPYFLHLCHTIVSLPVFVCAMAASGVLVASKDDGVRTKVLPVFLCCTFAYLALSFSPVYQGSRYLQPLGPMLCILAGYWAKPGRPFTNLACCLVALTSLFQMWAWYPPVSGSTSVKKIERSRSPLVFVMRDLSTHEYLAFSPSLFVLHPPLTAEDDGEQFMVDVASSPAVRPVMCFVPDLLVGGPMYETRRHHLEWDVYFRTPLRPTLFGLPTIAQTPRTFKSVLLNEDELRKRKVDGRQIGKYSLPHYGPGGQVFYLYYFPEGANDFSLTAR